MYNPQSEYSYLLLFTLCWLQKPWSILASLGFSRGLSFWEFLCLSTVFPITYGVAIKIFMPRGLFCHPALQLCSSSPLYLDFLPAGTENSSRRDVNGVLD